MKNRNNSIKIIQKNLEFKKMFLNKNKIQELKAEDVNRKQMQNKHNLILIILKTLIFSINQSINILTMKNDRKLEEFKVKKEKMEKEEDKELKRCPKKIVQLQVIFYL